MKAPGDGEREVKLQLAKNAISQKYRSSFLLFTYHGI